MGIKTRIRIKPLQTDFIIKKKYSLNRHHLVMSSIEVLCAAIWVPISGLLLTPMSLGVSLHDLWKWHGVQKQGLPVTRPFSETFWDCCLPHPLHPSFTRWNTPLEKPSGNNIYPSPLLTFYGQCTKNKQQSQIWMLCHCITETVFSFSCLSGAKISSNCLH